MLSNINSQKERFRVLHFLIPSSVSAELPKGFSQLEQRTNQPYKRAVEDLRKIYDEYVVRCPIKNRLKFSWASHDKEKSVYDFGKKFIAENNIKLSENITEISKIKKFLANQMIEERDRVLLSTQMGTGLL